MEWGFDMFDRTSTQSAGAEKHCMKITSPPNAVFELEMYETLLRQLGDFVADWGRCKLPLGELTALPLTSWLN